MLSLILTTLLSTVSAAPAGIVGSTYADVYPPGSTTVDRGLFPDRTVVGYPHVTRTGAQPYAIVTSPADLFPKVQQAFGPVVLPEARNSRGGKGKNSDNGNGKKKGKGKKDKVGGNAGLSLMIRIAHQSTIGDTSRRDTVFRPTSLAPTPTRRPSFPRSVTSTLSTSSSDTGRGTRQQATMPSSLQQGS